MSANEENQHYQSQDEADDDNVVYDDVVEVPSEYEVDEFTRPYISSQGDSVHLHPIMFYIKTADGTQRSGFLPPDIIAKSIKIWMNDLDDDGDERVSALTDALSEVIINDAPPTPGGESFMDLNSIPAELMKRNVIVPLQANSSDEETDDKKPSWLVLRQYPISRLEGLAKSFGGDEDPSIAESINQTCPSLEYMPQFYESRTGTALGVNANIAHECTGPGFSDFFYEPYRGMVMHGNKDIGMGIARGVTSFAKKTVFGITDSITKLTGSIGKGLSAATYVDQLMNASLVMIATNERQVVS
ncbi:hypothetical protein B9479_007079 [Cryptococcus floricola]|uniref:Uncharacterized protein n=1 Tax=Cryptococcus floricola TaxID=2591691 RepID=A0A5D3AQ69_9TREE|nr:hypothetical protein B9479_007079 [Cryptococcus floricola]